MVENDETPDVSSNADLNAKIKAAEDANRAKSEFLAHISHELRAPLGAILGFAEVLKNEDLSVEDRNQYLEIILRNGREMMKITSDLLDLSKIEARKFSVSLEWFDPKELLREVLSLFECVLKEKGLTIGVDFSDSVPISVYSDATRLRQIIINIVSNAIKFTASGGIEIRVGRRVDDQGRSYLEISVKDSGFGIPNEKIEQLFQPFSYGHCATRGGLDGTGLGLMLSRQIARSLGGDVVLDSTQLSEGSRFIIYIAEMFSQESPIKS